MITTGRGAKAAIPAYNEHCTIEAIFRQMGREISTERDISFSAENKIKVYSEKVLTISEYSTVLPWQEIFTVLGLA